MEQCVAAAQQSLEDLLEMETNGPFTLNQKYIMDSRAHFRDALNTQLCNLDKSAGGPATFHSATQATQQV